MYTCTLPRCLRFINHKVDLANSFLRLQASVSTRRNTTHNQPNTSIKETDKTAEEKGYWANYYLKHKEDLQQKNQEYYLKNKQGLREKKREHYLKNKATIQHKKQEYYAQKREEIQKKRQAYYLENKEAIRDKQQAYYLHHKEDKKDWHKKYRESKKDEIRQKKQEYYLRVKESKREQLRAENKEIIERKSWKTPEEVREFLESVARQYHVESPADWYRISLLQVQKMGGDRLLKKFGGLGPALKFTYPEVEWDEKKFTFRGKKSAQRWLYVTLAKLLPENTEITEEYLHPDLLWDENGNQKMELDIWVPKYSLALEYQGEQHYYDHHEAFGPSGTTALYLERDLKKKKLCTSRGITLVSIPFWWDGTSDSLSSTLHLSLSELFPRTEAPPVSMDPPPSLTSKKNKNEASSKSEEKIRSFYLMHGREWHADADQDPTGWFISEKLDGIRAFWDGKCFISKRGKVLPVPEEFSRTLPTNIKLDGELWAGYESFPKLVSIMKQSRDPQIENEKLNEIWKDVQFCVFDAPEVDANYATRHEFASSSIKYCSPQIQMIPMKTCLDVDHLRQELKHIVDRNGEGIMLYHPDALYTAGRSSLLLKVKGYEECDVQFVRLNPNSYSFVCKQTNGAEVIVKCGGWDYENPPTPGAVLAIRHSGYFKTSKKVKYPFLLRVKYDEDWEETKEEGEIKEEVENARNEELAPALDSSKE